MEQLAVNVLGPMEVRRRGVLVPIPSGKARTLLAMLLVDRDRMLRRAAAYAELWGDSVPVSAASNFRSYLAELRLWATGLGGHLFQGRHGWSLTISGSVDALQFQSMIDEGRAARRRGDRNSAIGLFAGAVCLYRDSPMADVSQGPALFGYAQALLVQWQSAVEDYAELLIEAGEPGRARLLLHDFLSRQPYRERAWGHLMVACSSSGDVAAAVDAFRRACGYLANDLNARPSPLLTSLHEAILRGDPQVRLRSEPAPRPERGRCRDGAALCAGKCVQVCGTERPYPHDKTCNEVACGGGVDDGHCAGGDAADRYADAGQTRRSQSP
ncbi:BTAD domain-containing putative transcriptional regulator [Micromonospora sp. NPDC047670]|uniref:AfsR/SARP family transcriptional regulator n=1 Tax=Micromonospora sp. NPDC047670 TaxID=3364252 RepID=UPI0037101DDB